MRFKAFGFQYVKLMYINKNYIYFRQQAAHHIL